jgi:hypothetical protein
MTGVEALERKNLERARDNLLPALERADRELEHAKDLMAIIQSRDVSVEIELNRIEDWLGRILRMVGEMRRG